MTLFYLSVGAVHGCVVAVLCRLAGWVCLGETRVSVVCLDVLCAVIFRLDASCFLPVVSARSLCFPESVSARAHGQWAKPICYLACLL